MVVKHKNLYLYLALTCFVGIILIFVFDGYMGVYDSLSITSGEFPQKIEADQWTEQNRYVPSASIGRDGKASFSYEVDNRLFSAYVAEVEASAWHGGEKIADLLNETITIGSFDKEQVEWVLDAAELIPADIPDEQNYDFTVIINMEETERRIIIYVNPVLYPPKPVIIEEPR